MPVRIPGSGAVRALLTAAILVLGIPNAHAAQIELPDAGATFQEEFDGDAWHADWSNWTPGPFNRAGPSTGVDGHGLTVTVPPGSHYGTRFSYRFPTAEQPETLYFRYYLRFAEDFGRDGTGKLPGPAGVYNGTAFGGRPSTPERPGWSARMLFAPGPREGTTLLGYYTYHLDQPGVFGEGMSWGATGVLDHGQWYCVEGSIELNTPGHHDGILRAWVNEQPAMERHDLSFRRAGEDHINISSFWFNVYFGGSETASAAKRISFDRLALGPERIGCGGAAAVAMGDIDGDGRDDAVELFPCGDGSCWTVESGGPLAFAPPTTRAASTRSSFETLLGGIVTGRFDDDALDDVAYLGRCDDGATCWLVHRSDGDAPGAAEEWATAPEGLPTAGLLAGDVDGDGRTDLVSRSSCAGRPCWQVQFSNGSAFGAPEDAGDGAYFSDATTAHGVQLADLTGDGRADLVYRGFCGDRQPCWRVQASNGTGFEPGVSWGEAADFASQVSGFETLDLNGDERHDLLYRSVCGASDCWRALLAEDAGFTPRYWGSEADLQAASRHGGFRRADVDGNGVDDIVYRRPCATGVCWAVHISTASGFISPGSGPIVDLVEPRPAFAGPDQPLQRSAVLS